MRARRRWGWPLVPVYAAGLWVKERLRGEAKRLGWPVVSVGSLSAGGAGKTPVVMALAEMLQGRGWGVDVLSRGYGRTGTGVERVSSEDAGRFGDEPVLLARTAEVWVGADRFAAGLLAEEAAGASGRVLPNAIPHPLAKDAKGWATEDEAGDGRRVHLLDDGFQHRGLARAVDVVLVTAEDLEEALLPAGNRREFLSALTRADVVVVRVEEAEVVGAWLEAGATQIPFGNDKKGNDQKFGALVWTVRRRLRFPAPLFVFGAGLRPVAFCAIARPEGFAAMLVEAGCGVVETVFFADHHAFAMEDIERVIEVAEGLKATGLVTTEKDAVKLTAAMRARIEAFGPLMVAELEAEFLFPERVARELEARLLPEQGARAL